MGSLFPVLAILAVFVTRVADVLGRSEILVLEGGVRFLDRQLQIGVPAILFALTVVFEIVNDPEILGSDQVRRVERDVALAV